MTNLYLYFPLSLPPVQLYYIMPARDCQPLLQKTFKKMLDSPDPLCYTDYSKRKGANAMINVRSIRKLQNNDGLTLKAGKVITYKSGWQVATEGRECATPAEAMKAVKAYNGNCGIWFSDGIYYIDKSHRVNTKREALTIGKACNQISVLRWRDLALVYC